MFEEFAKAMAMPTDDEMLERVLSQAKRKKDGHLYANRIALECDLDGLTRDGEYASKILRKHKDIAKRMGLA